VIVHLKEALSEEPNPEPGTWEHYKAVAPPYLTLWARWHPSTFQQLTPLKSS